MLSLLGRYCSKTFRSYILITGYSESGPAGEVPPPAQTSAPVFLGAASTASFSSLVAGAAAVAAVFLA